MTRQHLEELVAKHLDGKTTEAEKAFLQSYYDALDASPNPLDSYGADGKARLRTLMLARIREAVSDQQPAPVRRVYFLRRYRWVAAAACLLLAAGGWWFTQMHTTKPDVPTVSGVYYNDIAPGRQGARIRLSGNREYVIDSLPNGLIAMEGKVGVYKLNGKIVYKGKADVPVYNEIIEDKGKFTSVELPDGSTAWLNSSSSIRYPLVFAADERKVVMTGRAAFLVVHNANQPFRVYAAGQVFEDKGTEFNIDAYDAANVRMTVKQGLVQVKQTLVKQGEQATVYSSGGVRLLKDIDTDPAFAWRSNEFDFTRASVEEIMQEAARWYDIDVRYEGKISERFSLTVSRNQPISALLRHMELSGGIHFEISGKLITVKP